MTTRENWEAVKRKLESLPTKRLTRHVYRDDEGDFCALGALAQRQANDLAIHSKDLAETPFWRLDGKDNPFTRALVNEVESYGLDLADCSMLQDVNDEDTTKEQRYASVLAFVQEQIDAAD